MINDKSKCEYFTPDFYVLFLNALCLGGGYVGVRGGGYGTFGCFIGNSGPNLGPFKTTLERLNPTFHNTYNFK